MRRAARIDENQNAIVDALRAAGCKVCITSQVGDGFPDLVVYRTGRIYLLEIKSEHGKLKPKQKALIDTGWPVAVVRNVTEALTAVGLRIVTEEGTDGTRISRPPSDLADARGSSTPPRRRGRGKRSSLQTGTKEILENVAEIRRDTGETPLSKSTLGRSGWIMGSKK